MANRCILLLTCLAFVCSSSSTSTSSSSNSTPCSSELGCQLNGACVSGYCQCYAGWTGPQCSALKEGKSWVLWPQVEAQPYSAAWGSTMYFAKETQTYHLYSDVVYQLNASDSTYMTCFHTQGTQIVHSTSANATGPFEFADIATLPETNNPHMVATESGHLLLFHLNDDVEDLPIPACTGAGAGGGCGNTTGGQGLRTTCGHGSVGVAVSGTGSPQGPWKTYYPFCNIEVGAKSIANPSPYVMPDDSILLAYRYSNGVIHGQSEAIALARAKHFLGPYEIVNPDLTNLRCEDPFLFYSAVSDSLHILVHEYNGTMPYGDPAMISGAHLFSGDQGKTWYTSDYKAYDNHVTWANGTKTELNYRERPELIVNQATGQPQWLVTGAEWGLKYQYPTKGGPCQSVTIITEILP